ncbi:hypothetical protein DFS34DRAFT_412582 [Phlyctochytrium arcticum]|nr:hypothetical protein DFS34DRAFT_412582 [Phlyctochytrium arcticum]
MEEELKRSRAILHIDLDAFYCQVEHVRLGIPLTEPLCVQQWQGLIAVNYEARKAGIARHSTVEDALKKCPDLKLVHVATYAQGETEPKYHTSGVTPKSHKVSLEPYRRASRQIMAIFARHAPLFQRASIDEAYLDVTEVVLDYLKTSPMELDPSGEPIVHWDGAGVLVGEEIQTSTGWRDCQLRAAAEISQRIRREVWDELGYTCSAGIAHNKTLAKLCSGLNKPNKQTVIRESQVLDYMQKLPFTKIRSLGGKLGASIESAFKVETAGDLWSIPLSTLSTHFPASTAHWLQSISRGICNDPVTPVTLHKSMAACKSLRPPVVDEKGVRHWLEILAAELWTRVGEEWEVNRRWPKTLVLHTSRAGVGTGGDVSKSGPFPIWRRGAGSDSPGDEVREQILDKAVQMFGISSDVSATGEAKSARLKYPCVRMALGVSGFEKDEAGASGDLKKWFSAAPADKHESNDNGALQAMSINTEEPTLPSPRKAQPKPPSAFRQYFAVPATASQSESNKPATSISSAHTEQTDEPSTPILPDGDIEPSTNSSSPITIPTSDSYTSSLALVPDSQVDICPDCSQPLPFDPMDRQEHADFHFALKLQSPSPSSSSFVANNKRKAGMVGHGGNKKSRSAKTSKESGTLDGFFGLKNS